MRVIAALLLLNIACSLTISPFAGLWDFPQNRKVVDVIELIKKSKSGASQACPVRPIPVDLPSPLPQNITYTLGVLGTMLSTFLSTSTGASCVVAGFSYRGKLLWSEGVGTINKSNPNAGPPDENTIFRIGSVSKLFAGLTVYQLLAEGNIVSLDDPLQRYAQNFPMNEVTFRQVLSHLSGLPREAPCVTPCNFTDDEMFSMLSPNDLILPPFIRPSYSNLGFALLGRVGGIIADMDYEDYVTQVILNPLGMSNTGFEYTDDVISKMAVGYNADGSVADLYQLGWTGPAGQMYSTISDLLTFGQIFTASQNIITNLTFLREMTMPSFINSDLSTLISNPWESYLFSPYMVRMKGGNVPGFASVVAVIPELDLQFAMLINTVGANEFDIGMSAVNTLLPPLLAYLEANQPAVAYPPDPTPYIGTYLLQDGTKTQIVKYNYQGEPVLLLATPIMNVFLRFISSDLMAVYIPQGLISCFGYELDAFNDQHVVFQTSGGNVASFTIPNLITGAVFTKQ